jgi:hypothetical protein
VLVERCLPSESLVAATAREGLVFGVSKRDVMLERVFAGKGFATAENNFLEI